MTEQRHAMSIDVACWFGRHGWTYREIGHVAHRWCPRCGKAQFWWSDAWGRGWKP